MDITKGVRTLIVCLAWPHFFFEPHKIFIPSTSESNLPTNENFFFYIKRYIFECGVNYYIIKESVEKNNVRELGIAKDVQINERYVLWIGFDSIFQERLLMCWLCCQRDLSDILTDSMKSKNLMLETRSCTNPVSALYYRMEDYVPVCAFCGEKLNEENIKKWGKFKNHQIIM